MESEYVQLIDLNFLPWGIRQEGLSTRVQYFGNSYFRDEEVYKKEGVVLSGGFPMYELIRELISNSWTDDIWEALGKFLNENKEEREILNID